MNEPARGTTAGTILGAGNHLRILLWPSPEIPGFHCFRIDRRLTLYLPIGRLEGPWGAATALSLAAAELAPQSGAHTALAAAMMFAAFGDELEACRLVDPYGLLSSETESITRRLIQPAAEHADCVEDCGAV